MLQRNKISHFFVILFCAGSAVFAQLDETELAMVDFIDRTNPEAVELLIESVNINSGTMNLEGVRKAGDHMMPHFEAIGFKTHWVDGSGFNRSGHLVAEYRGNGSGPKILMIGHLDTVFELDSPFQEFKWLEEDRATGPGVVDMKGGNVIILQALRALHEVGALEKMDITVIITGDEELPGRPLSLGKEALINAASYADIALGFENGDGKPTTANISRRGSTKWMLKVTGKPAHSSQIFRDDIGYGAIYEASRILVQFVDKLKHEENLTFNPGHIVGGTDVTHDLSKNSGTAFGKTNVIAKHAVVAGDLRAVSIDQLERARVVMRQVVADHLPQTDAEITFFEGYPPLSPTEGNARLLSLYSEVSIDLGTGPVAAVDPRLAGAADISFTSGYVEGAIDGLGLSGSGGHTENETADMLTLPSQSKRAALLLYRLYK